MPNFDFENNRVKLHAHEKKHIAALTKLVMGVERCAEPQSVLQASATNLLSALKQFQVASDPAQEVKKPEQVAEAPNLPTTVAPETPVNPPAVDQSELEPQPEPEEEQLSFEPEDDDSLMLPD